MKKIIFIWGLVWVNGLVAVAQAGADYMMGNGPSRPPEGSVRPIVLRPEQMRQRSLEIPQTTADSATVYEVLPEDAVVLDVPTSTWTYGCVPTALGMIMAYYDRLGYMNIYEGPCNGGLAPMINVGQGDDPGNPIPGSCSLIASMEGFDGKIGRGHVDDYWIETGEQGPDPYQVNGWEEHAPDCIADYLGASMWKYEATDGLTWYYNYNITRLDARINDFLSSRGYNASVTMKPWVSGNNSYISFDVIKNEINAGRPVMLTLAGDGSYLHSVTCVGYHEAPDTLYIHDTWDNELHSMLVDGLYANEYYLRFGDYQYLISMSALSTGTLSLSGFSQDAIDAGAQWRLLGGPDTKWKEVDDSIGFIPVGTNYVLEFKPLPGWEVAEPSVVGIVEGTNTISGSFYTWAGGRGTIDNPHIITNNQQLLDWFSMGEYYYDSHFKLMSDIDLSGEVLTSALIAPNEDGPIDFIGTPFTGTFNGNGHVISNLTINTVSDGDTKNDSNSYLGLFGKIGEQGHVYDLGLENVSIISGSESKNVGGLCGDLRGRIRRCFTHCSITNGAGNIGGLCGISRSGVIDNSYAIGVIDGGANYQGGLCGNACDLSVEFSYAAVALSGEDAGGLIHDSAYDTYDISVNKVISSYWDLDASQVSVSDGGNGVSLTQMVNKDTYLGWDQSWCIKHLNDYPRLAWQSSAGGPMSNVCAKTYVGEGTTSLPYILSTPADLLSLSKRPCDWGGVFSLENDINMKGVTNYVPLGVFTGVFNGNDYEIQNLVVSGQTYMGLIGCLDNARVVGLSLIDVDISGQKFAGGLCGVNTSSLVSGCYVAGSLNAANSSRFIGGLCGLASGQAVIQDSCSEIILTAGNESWYVGGFVGCNSEESSHIGCNSIADLQVGGSDTSAIIGGFCGGNIDNGILEHCGSTGVVVATYGKYVGGFCGYNSLHSDVTSSSQASRISCCKSIMNVTGIRAVGGLVGVQQNTGYIDNSYSLGSVTGSGDYVAGFCGGITDGLVARCYSLASVSGASTVGGFIAKNFNATISACFWDTQLSGMTSSDGGIGKTTAEMKDSNTFLGAGWDYVKESVNGDMDLWYQPSNSYPRLFWEASPGDVDCNGNVDYEDALKLDAWWGKTGADIEPSGRLHCDFNYDGVVNDADFQILIDGWLDAYVDEDGDGVANLSEFIAGTDPANNTSCFMVVDNSAEVNGTNCFVVGWDSISNRLYNVYWSSNLVAEFHLLEGDVVHPQNSVTDIVHNAESECFYRVDVQLWDE